MRAAHGVQAVEEKVSSDYLTEELESIYCSLEIALPAEAWESFHQMTSKALAQERVRIARRMCLSRYEKHSRGPKKPQPSKNRVGGRGCRTYVHTGSLAANVAQVIHYLDMGPLKGLNGGLDEFNIQINVLLSKWLGGSEPPYEFTPGY
ncbi:MAG TPA: hypothetical protein VEC99_17275 [Clostridia bacterium]|nr:hypothetical protein [Clostridia bacterium]